MKEETCWLCLRTSPKRILEVSHRLFDPELGHRIGMRGAELLRDAYLRSPPALCGRKTSALIAGAMYVACLLEDVWVTQREVAEACGITETSVRYSYRRLIRVLGLEDRLLVKLDHWARRFPITRLPGSPVNKEKEVMGLRRRKRRVPRPIVSVTVKLPVDQAQRLYRLASLEFKGNISATVRRAIDDFLKGRGHAAKEGDNQAFQTSSS